MFSSNSIAFFSILWSLLIVVIGVGQYQQQYQLNQSQQYFQNLSQANSNPILDDRNFRLNQDKREILQYLNTKNVIRTMLKLLFGSTEESMVTSRQVLNVFVKVSSHYLLTFID